MAGRRIVRRDRDDDSLRTGVLLLAVAAAFALRMSEAPVVEALRDTLQEVVARDMDYRQAVWVIGRAAAGEEGNAVLVFGRRLLSAGRTIGEQILT